MCDEPGVRLRTTLRSLEKRVPKIILQRVEEYYPAVMESVVSVLRQVPLVQRIHVFACISVLKDITLPILLKCGRYKHFPVCYCCMFKVSTLLGCDTVWIGTNVKEDSSG